MATRRSSPSDAPAMRTAENNALERPAAASQMTTFNPGPETEPCETPGRGFVRVIPDRCLLKEVPADPTGSRRLSEAAVRSGNRFRGFRSRCADRSRDLWRGCWRWRRWLAVASREVPQTLAHTSHALVATRTRTVPALAVTCGRGEHGRTERGVRRAPLEAAGSRT